MWLLIVEALAALALLVFIVWWTMSSRRKTPAHPAEAETADAHVDPGQIHPAGVEPREETDGPHRPDKRT